MTECTFFNHLTVDDQLRDHVNEWIKHIDDDKKQEIESSFDLCIKGMQSLDLCVRCSLVTSVQIFEKLFQRSQLKVDHNRQVHALYFCIRLHDLFPDRGITEVITVREAIEALKAGGK